jgi:hypothetical protein
MGRDHCPPSRRGHTWREARLEDLVVFGVAMHPALRVCKRCGKLGRVNKQGMICTLEGLIRKGVPNGA